MFKDPLFNGSENRQIDFILNLDIIEVLEAKQISINFSLLDFATENIFLY